jgi:hypothetical protein
MEPCPEEGSEDEKKDGKILTIANGVKRLSEESTHV